LYAPDLPRSFLLRVCLDFEDDLEFDWHPEGKAGDANYHPHRCFLNAKDISKEVRDGVCNFGLVEEVSGSGYEYSEADDASHSIERAQMLFGRGENAQCRGVGGVSSSLDVELFSKPANVFGLVVYDGSIPLKNSRLPVCTVST